jgi:16S rRNA U516 pseudouridylate synthase RsuA-like enzyme
MTSLESSSSSGSSSGTATAAAAVATAATTAAAAAAVDEDVDEDASRISIKSLHVPRVVDYRRRVLPLDKDVALRILRIKNKIGHDDNSNSSTTTKDNRNNSNNAAGNNAAAAAAALPTSRVLIQQRRVHVNGVIVDDPSVDVDGDCARVHLDGTRLPPRAPLAYWVLHKPRQVLTSRARSNRDHPYVPLVTEFYTGVPFANSILPVGRLDLESEGLLVLTNDGSLNRILTSPEFGVRKVYRCLAGRDLRNGCATPVWQNVEALLATLVLPPGSGTNKRKSSGSSSGSSSSGSSGSGSSSGGSGGSSRNRRRSRRRRRSNNNNSNNNNNLQGEIGCVSVELRDQYTCARVQARATSGTHLIVVDMTMASGKNREVRRLLKSLGFRTFMLCRVAIQGVSVSCSLPADVAGVVRHVQREAGVQLREGVDGAATLTPEDVAWVRDCSDNAALRSGGEEDPARAKAAFDAVRAKAHRHSISGASRFPLPVGLQPGGMRALREDEVDVLFGRYASERGVRGRGCLAAE